MADTRKLAAEYRLAHWAGIMKERTESGLTVKAFCESSGVHLNSYFYWQRKLCESALESVEAGVLTIPEGWAAAVRTGQGSLELPIDIGKCRVIANNDTDEKLLLKVCRVLASL
jgi:hypothetical protein